jgi:predicted  nucleic acid-binding Zn-ribbon protein
MSKNAGGFIVIFVPIVLALGGAIWWGVDIHKKVNYFRSKADIIESVSSKQSDSLEKVALIDYIKKDMAEVKKYLNKVDHTIGPLSRESHQFAEISKKIEDLSKKVNNISAQVNKLDAAINERVGNIEDRLIILTQEQENLKEETINRITIIEDTLPKLKMKK